MCPYAGKYAAFQVNKFFIEFFRNKLPTKDDLRSVSVHFTCLKWTTGLKYLPTVLWLLYQPTETHQAFFLRIRYSRIASCTEFFKNIDRKILWLNKVQLDQTFKILSYNGSAYFQPRNKKVLEKINDLPSLTNWFNPTDWTKIIKSTINYTDSVYEKERFSTHIDKSGKRNPKKKLE